MAFEADHGEVERAGAGVSVIHAEPAAARPCRRAVAAGAAVAVVVVVAALAVSAERVASVNGAGFTTVAFAVLVGGLLVVAVVQARSRVRWRSSFEVAGDRIVFRSGVGPAQSWRRDDGDGVEIRGGRVLPRLYIADSRADVSVWRMREFPLEELRAACVRHGWSWRERHSVFDAQRRPSHRDASSKTGAGQIPQSKGERIRPPKPQR
ncbi:MAG TPA: hypothetical protein H9902_00390 [Candidatus Stackebrandtia faecavium]|nr:hypothetical protein [Candidatus Stackebrandtia faecavium]